MTLESSLPHSNTGVALALLSTAVLAACGGGDSTSTTVPSAPTSAGVQCDYAYSAFNASAWSI
jgi:hypothetical protein